MLDERTRQNRKMKKFDLIWPFDLECDLQGQMPFWQAGVSESLAHSDTFWHGCQLWTKNAIKSFFEGLGLPTISSMRWIPCTVHLMLSRRKIRTRYRTSIRVIIRIMVHPRFRHLTLQVIITSRFANRIKQR